MCVPSGLPSYQVNISQWGRTHLLFLSLQVPWNTFTYLSHLSPQRTRRSMPQQYCGQVKWEHLLISGGLETTQRFVFPMDWGQNNLGGTLWLRREEERDLEMLLNSQTKKKIVNQRQRLIIGSLMDQCWNVGTVLWLLLWLSYRVYWHFMQIANRFVCIFTQGGCREPKSQWLLVCTFPLPFLQQQ